MKKENTSLTRLKKLETQISELIQENTDLKTLNQDLTAELDIIHCKYKH